jgi:serine/threonine protein kinase
MEEDGRSIDEKKMQNYFAQILLALYYCKTKNVAHRDLKPQNILVDDKLIKVHVKARFRTSDSPRS